MTDRSGAEIITFYSYKGGTGRSMHLANVAWILASNGKRVLMVDWDLEAPGLHHYFRPFLVDKDLIATDGLIDLMWHFTEAAMTPVPEVERVQGWHEPYADLLPYTAAVRWVFPLPGRLDLLPAGRQGPSYSRNVNSFNWQNFYDRLGGGVFLESLKAQMRKEYDYVLIDSRTGVSDTAGICTVQMPDALVVCFTANNQSIEGCASIVQSVRAQWADEARRSPGRQRILPLLTRVDGSEKDKLNARRAFARSIFDPYVAAIAPDAIDEYWRDVEVPYVPWYSYEEVIAAFADKYKEKISVLDSAEALTRMLTGGVITSMVRPGDAERVRVLGQFAAIGDAVPETPVSHAPEVVIPSPYLGMRPFTGKDATLFFGREEQVDDILGRLRAGERELYIIGPSGSGKSSLVAAGVLPRLERGVSGLGTFLVRWLRPGDHPAARLGETLEGEVSTPVVAIDALLARHAPGASLLLVIDQFEEVFALASYGERATFVGSLRALRSEPRCVLLFTLRADFFSALMDSPLCGDLEGRISWIAVAPLRGAALRAAIERPARERGVFFEPELLERLIGDAASEPGVLPLLQETLTLLWDQRRLPLLTLAEYEALGDGSRSGLVVAIARRIDATMRALTVAQQTMARRILLRLVSFGEGRPDTRRQQPVRALQSATDDAAEFSRVLQRLIEDRLVTVGSGEGNGYARADLSHEALITAWPVFQEWILQRRGEEQRRRQLDARVGEWLGRGRGTEGLLEPKVLLEAEGWMQSDVAQELGYGAELLALVAASQREINKLARQRRWRTLRAIAALAAVSIVSILGFVALRQRDRQQSHRLLGVVYVERGQALLLDGHPMQALPYFVAARTEGIDSPVLRMSFAQASRNLPSATFAGHALPVTSAAFSPDGEHVVTASNDATACVWDAQTGKAVSPPLQHRGTVFVAAFSPDGKRVVTASDDKTARVWDASTGQPVTPPLAHQGPVRTAAFSPDGKWVVTASDDKTARVWDVSTGQPVTSPLEHQGAVYVAVFSTDGTRVITASTDKAARVWNASTGQPVTPSFQYQGAVHVPVFSPDGTRVITVSNDNAAQVWDTATGEPVTPPLPHQGAVYTAAFSPDGTRVVTAGQDRKARVWDASTGQPVTLPLEHQGFVVAAAFSVDGTRIVTASKDKTARVWNALTGRPVTPLLEHPGFVFSAAFSPDGLRVVTVSQDNVVRVWDASSVVGMPVPPPLEHGGVVYTAAFSPDGTRVVTGSQDKTAQVWDALTSTPVTPPLEHQGFVFSAAFSSDGTRVVTASEDKTARVWDALRGTAVTPPLEHQGQVNAAVFSPDGKRVVTASFDKTARVWDASTGRPVTPPLKHQSFVGSAAFSPDGTRVVTASFDKTAQIWDASTGKAVAGLLKHQGGVYTAAFSPDGTRVVTASEDKTARIWDASTGGEMSPPLKHQGGVYAAAFSPDGTRVVTASEDKTAQVWDASTGTPVTPPLKHQGGVYAAAFSPDGTRVVTASADKTVRVWDATTGKPMFPPLMHQGDVKFVVFSPDGGRVITASGDKAAQVWAIPLDNRTLAEWSAIADRGPYIVIDGVLSLRPSPAGD